MTFEIRIGGIQLIMLTFESILPPLKRNEKILAQKELNNGEYVQFTIQFSRFRYRKVAMDVYVEVKEDAVWIRYHHSMHETWAKKEMESFLERLKEQIRLHPSIRLRAVTGAMKLHIQSFIEEDMEGEYVDKDEMTGFFLSVFLGFASIFEVTSFFGHTTLAFQIGVAIIALGCLYGAISVSLENHKEVSRKELLTVTGVLLVLGAIMWGGLSICLFISLAIAWILPWWVAIPMFLIVTFGYSWATKMIRKMINFHQKYSSKA